jgi:hypothetical protein
VNDGAASWLGVNAQGSSEQVATQMHPENRRPAAGVALGRDADAIYHCMVVGSGVQEHTGILQRDLAHYGRFLQVKSGNRICKTTPA